MLMILVVPALLASLQGLPNKKQDYTTSERNLHPGSLSSGRPTKILRLGFGVLGFKISIPTPQALAIDPTIVDFW